LVNDNLQALRVNSKRFRANFEALARIGSTSDGGVHRPALSDAHLKARAWFIKRIKEAGLHFRVDSAGNHSALLRCGPADGSTLLLGSHLDSVPEGGRFDGALGVLAALEALQVVRENNISLPFHLEAIDFTDEEGTLVGLLGSAALAGKLSTEALQDPRGGRDHLLDRLSKANLSQENLFNARREPVELAGYLELHIEQGKRLQRADADIGVVSSIVGIGSCRIIFEGRADHAGTTPMEDRLDAALGASSFTLAVREVTQSEFPHCVANVGQIQLFPAAFNIVPGRAIVSLEFRAPDSNTLNNLETALLNHAQLTAEKYNLGLNTESLGKHPPSPMDAHFRETITQAAQSLKLKTIDLVSGAGHDAQSFAEVCPSGMVFVPSVSGASHSPREYTEWQDCLNGANVLLQVTLRLADLWMDG
jgi:N-carbamoyl-L-amino-acid hydrolase